MIKRKHRKILSFVLTLALLISNFAGIGKLNLVFAAGLGTPESPYSVAEGLAKQGEKGKTVQGYIVGQPKSDKSVLFNSFDADTAIAIADSKSETDPAKMLYVKLGTTPAYLRTDYGLKAHPEGIGKLINVTGDLAAYFTPHAGITTVTEVKPAVVNVPLTGLSFKGNSEVELNKSAKLELQYAPLNTTEKDVDWKSSDETVATVTTDGTVSGLKVGTTIITATSKVNPTIKAETKVTVIEPAPATQITLADARTKAVGTDVEVEGIVTFVDAGSTTTNTYIQDGSGAIDLYYSNSIGLKLNQGDHVRVKGKIATFNGLLEVKITDLASAKVVSTENLLPEPKVITVAQANSEDFESQRVLIKDVTLGATDSKTNNTEISDASGNKAVLYKMPALTGIVAGDVVDVTAIVSQYSKATPPAGGYQLRVAAAADVVKAAVQPDKTKPVITHTQVTTANIANDIEILATITDNKAVSGAKVYYRTKGDTTYKTVDMVLANNIYSAVIPKADLNTKGLEYYIEATDTSSNVATAPDSITTPYSVTISNADIAGPEITKVEPADGTKLDAANTKPTISVEYNDATGVAVSSIKLYIDDALITGTINKTATSLTYAVENALSLGSHTAKIELSDTLGNKASKTWSFAVGTPQYNPYFGQLHSHTSLSDGVGTPDEAFKYARDEAKADYVAITDHSNWFDDEKNLANETITDVSQSTSTEWKDLHKSADAYTQDGKFVAIAGFEMTWSGSTGGWGHINTFNTPWFTSRSNSKMDLNTYYNKLSEADNKDSISQLNHPGKTFGDFADFGYYSQGADNVVDLVEAGNGEGLVRSSGYFPSIEYYTRALDKGWHLAPTNNQDNHKGKWVNANTARTVILADKLTKDSLYDAMRNRRVYSTEDENLRISYTVNDEQMGTILNKPTSLKAKISITDPDSTDKVGKVSIVSDGGAVVASKEFDSNTANWNLDLPQGYKYYYVRVDEADKDIAVTAPVWAGSVVPVGISKVEVSQDPQVVNTPENITATVYNNGTTALSNVTVDFYKNEITDANKIGSATIANVAPAGADVAKLTWTPTEIGETKIYAKTTIKIDGLDNIFTQSTSFTVAKAEDLVKVVIDGGHQNQYVSGDYAGKMLTLASMLKDKKYMLVQNNDELTAKDLEGAKILIITDPQSKVKDPLAPQKFSASELQVIKDFTAAGGNLIITSRADYDDKGVTDHSYESSVQGNSVLEAIGSNLRFNDDEVVDNTSNGGQAFRLYFDNYTGSKYHLTDNLVAGQTYSAYSGCSVILKNGGDDSKVDWLVKGHDTTETLDSDGSNDAVPVQKGNVYSLAAEQLSNGSKVVVAGTTFLSDFETASQDNSYSNKDIADHIISWMTTIPAELKTIAEVRVDANKDGVPDNLGKRYAIEGIVTAQSEAVTPKNAFFEVIYVQDATGGITVFGVSQTPVQIGQKVRITGFVDQYGGDTEIQIDKEANDLQVLDTNIKPVAPKTISTGDSMKDENEGWLVKITGKVTKMDAQNIYLDDGTGVARAYVEGYIGDGSGDDAKKGKWDPSITVGSTVTIVGLASEDPDGHRLRVRNTAEIVKVVDVDKTAPVITVAGVGNSGLYNVDVTPVITVNEGTLVMMLNNKPYNGEKITEDGVYVLDITATDAAGNVSKTSVVFTVDKTAPIITVSNLDNNQVFVNSNASPKVTANEGASVTMTLDGKTYDGSTIKELGTHKLVVTAVDKAGNKSVKELSFTLKAEVTKDADSTAAAIKDLVTNTNSDKVVVSAQENPVIAAKVFEAVKGIDKKISFVVESQGLALTWTFNGKDVKDTNTTVDLTLNAVSPNKDILAKIDSNAQVISFKNHGVLPAPMTVTIPVDTKKFDVTKPLYFYFYNETTKKAELVGDGLMAYKKGDAYFVDVTITHNSDYFLSANDNKTVTTTVDKLVQTGSPIDMNVLLGLGVILIACGAFVVMRKRRHE